MREPFLFRQGIPFYYHKTEQEFKLDPYENYDDMVIRQTALHLADELWQGYPMQAVLDFVLEHLEVKGNEKILEIGGSVGRIIGTVASNYPNSKCWALDSSYQLLKRAKEFWIGNTAIQVDGGARGVGRKLVFGKSLANLQLGLAKAEDLPFDDVSQDFVIHSFLLDRLDDPLKGLSEMHRILKNQGRMVMITPLNFLKRKHWENFYPVEKLLECIHDVGFHISDYRDDISIIEPLDVHGNVVLWKCIGVVCDRQDEKT